MSTLQFKPNMFAFEEILLTDLSLMSDFQSQNLSVLLPLLRSASTISARSKLQKTGDLPLQERGIHSHVVTSSPSTARHSTELHSDMQEQGCPFQDKDNQTKYSTCLKGISHKSLLHSWTAKHLFRILKTGRRSEHSNNLYTTRVLNIPQNPCFSKYMKFQQPRIKSRSLPLFFHCEKNSVTLQYRRKQ